MAHVAKLLDRECPRCGAAAAIKCRDLRRPQKTAAREHIARGWLDRPCGSCHAQAGERCVTPAGRYAAAVHRARWEQRRLAAQRYGYVWVAPDETDLEQPQREALNAARCMRIWADRPVAVVPTVTFLSVRSCWLTFSRVTSWSYGAWIVSRGL